MRATWVTSAAAGVFFAIFTCALAPWKDSKTNYLIGAAFLISTFLGVYGIGQLREELAERKRRGVSIFGMMARKADFDRFYIPAWGRCMAYFTGVASVVVAWQLLT